MVQSGDDYREKNRIRLQRFYEKQKQQGKKRVSALVSDEAYRLLTDQKDQAGESISVLVDQAVMIAYGEQGIPDIMSDEAYALLMDAREQTGDSMSMLIDRAVMAAYSGQGEDILDIDDLGWTEPVREVTHSADAQGDDAEEIELEISLDPETDDAALVDQEPDTDTHAPDTIPDCTGKTSTIEERDNILLQVERLLPGKENAQARVDMLNEKAVPVIVKAGKHGGTWDKRKFSNNLRLAKKRMENQLPVTDKNTMRDLKLVDIAEKYPGRENAQKRVDILNASGLTLKGVAGEWTRKKFTDNLRFAKKRLGII